jgi:hypothetical protein
VSLATTDEVSRKRWRHPPGKPGSDRNAKLRAKLMPTKVKPSEWKPRAKKPKRKARLTNWYSYESIDVVTVTAPVKVDRPLAPVKEWPVGTHRMSLPSGEVLHVLPFRFDLVKLDKSEWGGPRIKAGVIDVESGDPGPLTSTPPMNITTAADFRAWLINTLTHELDEVLRLPDGTALTNPHPGGFGAIADDYVPRQLRPQSAPFEITFTVKL